MEYKISNWKPTDYTAPKEEQAGDVAIQTSSGFITKEDRKNFQIGGGDRAIKVDNKDGLWAGNAVSSLAPTGIDLDGNFRSSLATITGGSVAAITLSISTYQAGENITKNKALMISNGVQIKRVDPTMVANANDNSFGKVAPSQVYEGSRFNPQTSIKIDEVKIYLRKVGAPTDNVKLAIQADLPPTSIPNGTDIVSATINGAGLGAAYAEITFTFASAAQLASGYYWVVLSRSGATSDTDYYEVQTHDAGGGSSLFGATRRFYNGTVWSAATADRGADMAMYYTPTTGKIYAASAYQALSTDGFLGFSLVDYADGTYPEIKISQVTGFTSLTPLALYYLDDRSGGISTSAGTVSKIAGRAINSTTLLVIPS